MTLSDKVNYTILYYRDQKLNEINEDLKIKSSLQYNKFKLKFGIPSFLTNYEKDEIVDQILDILYYCKYNIRIVKDDYNKKFDNQFINFNINMNDSLYNQIDEQFNDEKFKNFNNNYNYLSEYISIYNHNNDKDEFDDYIIYFDIDSDLRSTHYLKYDESHYSNIINQLNMMTRQQYKLYARKQYYKGSTLSLDILDAIVEFIEIVEDNRLTNKVLKITLEKNRLNDYYNRMITEIDRMIEYNDKLISSVSYDRQTILIKLKDDDKDV